GSCFSKPVISLDFAAVDGSRYGIGDGSFCGAFCRFGSNASAIAIHLPDRMRTLGAQVPASRVDAVVRGLRGSLWVVDVGRPHPHARPIACSVLRVVPPAFVERSRIKPASVDPVPGIVDQSRQLLESSAP